jgi:hypothetical protein
VGVEVAHDKRGDEGVKRREEDMGEYVASAFVGDLVVNVNEVENLIPSSNVEEHGGEGGHGVVKVVYNRDGAVYINSYVGDHFTCIVRIVFRVDDVPIVIGSNPKNIKSKWIGV